MDAYLKDKKLKGLVRSDMTGEDFEWDKMFQKILAEQEAEVDQKPAPYFMGTIDPDLPNGEDERFDSEIGARIINSENSKKERYTRNLFRFLPSSIRQDVERFKK